MQSFLCSMQRTLIWAVVLSASFVGLVTPTLAANDEQPKDANLVCPEDLIPFQGDCLRLPSSQEAELDREYCESSQENARVCCNDPIQCLTGHAGPSMGAINAAGSLTIAALALTHSRSANNGVAASCNLMKKVALGGAIANTALGAKCFGDKASCEERCQAVVEKYQRVLGDCEEMLRLARIPGGMPSRCSGHQRQLYYSLIATARGRGDRCSSYNANVAQLGNSAVQSIAASRLASLCESAAQADTPQPSIEPLAADGNCLDPANSANPICARCRGYQAAYDPLCRAVDGSGTSRSQSESRFRDASASLRRNDGSDLVVPEVTEQNQKPRLDSLTAEKASANPVPNNGGGFSPPTGSAGFQSSGSDTLQAQDGYPTDILHGAGSVGGFVASGLPTTLENRAGFAGAFGGFTGGQLRDARLNLRRFLPGESNLAHRHLAGQSDLKPKELGHRHEDIFKRISQRVIFLCRTKRLICE